MTDEMHEKWCSLRLERADSIVPSDILHREKREAAPEAPFRAYAGTCSPYS